MKKITVGILAHVDAGKTTLSEALLFNGGVIRKQGRVDDKNAFLDTNALEKQRGITIFSKCARINLEDRDVQIILVDTPGHVDFAAETERALSVLDVAVLVINGTDGVGGHVRQLWGLLRENNIPTIVFVNKIDIQGFDKDKCLENIKKDLSDNIIDFSLQEDELFDSIATCDEELMDEYIENGQIADKLIASKVMQGVVYPCLLGSALRNEGVKELLDFIAKNCSDVHKCEGEELGAIVYKISHDEKGTRLTNVRVISGSIKVKSNVGEEKINEIRLYNGGKYENVLIVSAGDICALTGLNNTKASDILGKVPRVIKCESVPVMSYGVSHPSEKDVTKMLGIMRLLEDELPEIAVVYKESLGQIQVSLMGEIQTEILRELILERCGIEVEFINPRIVYKETIADSVNGAGHYEPLRHYADVRLRLEPMPRGAGMSYESKVSTDELDKNWQRLILTHMAEREHVGVLTGSAICDVKLVLAGGKAHLKHTEGGDFREATYRAIRQGLMRAESILLEPYYEYRLTLDSESVGRAIHDIESMHGLYEINTLNDGRTLIVGKAPVATMNGYVSTVASYTHGNGILELKVLGYEKCHNSGEIISEYGYNPEADIDNPVDSVFCSHGAGHTVKWNDPLLMC